MEYIFNGSIINKCVDIEHVHVFFNGSSHSSWTEIFGEPGGLQEQELRGKFKPYFNFTQKMTFAHFEDILNVDMIEEKHLSHKSVLFQENVTEHSHRRASSQTDIKETCADTFSISPNQTSYFTQRTILTTEKERKVILANSSCGGALSLTISKMVTRKVRPLDQDEPQSFATLAAAGPRKF